MTTVEGRWDRVGIIASVACTIHCLVAPLIFLFLPKIAGIWAHPASHALVAVVVVPMALAVIRKGFRVHGRKWVMASAVLGIAFILVGSVLPYLEGRSSHHHVAAVEASLGGLTAPATAEPCEDGSCTEDPTLARPACEACPEPDCAACDDAAGRPGASCCPQVVVDETSGKKRLVLPAASIVTLLGSFFLVTGHIGNLVAGRGCKVDCC